MKKIVLLLILSCLVVLSVYAQNETITVPLEWIKSEYPILHKRSKTALSNTYIVSKILEAEVAPKFPDLPGMIPPRLHTCYLSRYRLPFPIDSVVAAVYFSERNPDEYAIIFDNDGNYSLYDELILRKTYDRNRPGLTVLTRGEDKYPVQFVVNPKTDFEGGIGHLQYSPLQYLQTSFPTEEDTTMVYLNYYHDNLRLSLEDTPGKKYRLNESIIFGKQVFRYESVDLDKMEASFFVKPHDGRVYGYKEGNFVKKTDIVEQVIPSLDKSYTLLYFWGYWCGSCIEHFDQTYALQLQTEATGQIDFVYINLLARDKDRENTERMLTDYPGIGQQTYFDILNRFSCKGYESGTSETCNLVKLLEVHKFPTYLLIDRDGKILYRGANQNERLEEIIGTL